LKLMLIRGLLENYKYMEAEKTKANKIALAVDVAIFNSTYQVLLGKRLNSAGHGTWSFPGGHILDEEEIMAAAHREIKEELGNNLEVKILNKIIAVRDNCLPPQFVRHITIILEGEYIQGDAIVNEPDKCEEWKWFDINALPSPLFPGTNDILENYVKKISSVT